MFERFIRLAKAKQALRDRCFEDALALAADPLIQADRRAEDIRGTAAAALLQRARRHLDAGEVAAARAELGRVRGFAPSAEAEALAAAVETAASADHAAVDLARRTLAEARKSVANGETAAAAALLAAVGPSHLLLEREQLEHLLVERRRQAAVAAEDARSALQAGNLAAAIDGLGRAEALDRDAGTIATLRSLVFAAAADQAASAVRAALAEHDHEGALARHRQALQRLPGLAATEPMAAVGKELLVALRRPLQAARSLDAVLPLATAVVATELGDEDPNVAPIVALCVAIVHGSSRGGRGENGPAAARLRSAAEAVGAAGLVAAAAELAASSAAADGRLAGAHALVDRGDLDGARAALLQLLAADPLHEAARRDLGLVEQSLAELGRRLEEVRAAARAGRLREACTAALALTGSTRVAAEAQQLAAEIRSRIAVVDRGLDEVRVALHGRLAAGIEGIRHLQRRLEELAKVQADHDQLPAMLEAVRAEIAALGLCENAAKAVERHAVDEAFAAVLELVPLCDRLLAKDRLEARICSLADRLRASAEGALAAARLTEAERCAELLEQLRPIRAEFGAHAATIRAAVGGRRDHAEQMVEQAREKLACRDLAEAERLVEQALAQWLESPRARSLAAQIADLRRQSDALARVDAMTKDGDFLGARQKLAAMPPSQPLLRTRIYDMKTNLARAQGLDGAFLLRVDEGGEHLVLRGESVSIGNVRQARADLPVLANLAGLHATIRRSMSFHGGMQDTVVAGEGEVRVGGKSVAEQPLAPGDRVQLGSSFAFAYHRPSARSLSAAITLQGGFQVAGTDRILLMKDRGKDGRLLLGAANDVHVRVPGASGEVEVFATNTGQIRVRCDVGGTIDGVPFRGEHPVAAGQVVVASGISFLLLPWRPAA